MADPLYQKLKADAEVILLDLWRMLRHLEPVQEWQHVRAMPELEDTQKMAAALDARPPHSSGLCYFHLN